MKQIYTFFMGYCVALLFAGCNEDTGRVVYPYSCPQMSGLTFSFAEEVTATDSIWFSVEITDPGKEANDQADADKLAASLSI